jgi:peptidoglycan/xylan/chitin deacetylase (PgdA/CDA1 family)
MLIYIKRLLFPLTSWLKNRLLGAVIGYDVTPRKIVALTFDDGPDPPHTIPVLDALDEHRARATFFLSGRNVDLFPEVAFEIVRRGHAVGSHTYNHPSLVGLNIAAVMKEIREGQKSINRVTGKKPYLFRPPYGDFDLTSLVTTRLMGLLPVLWTTSGEDWQSISSDDIVKRILVKVQPGSIILLHDKSSRTVETIHELLKALSAEGYQFVTLPEMNRFPERYVYYTHLLPFTW